MPLASKSRISVGTVVDSSTCAKWFMKGSHAKIKDTIMPTAMVVTVNDIELVMLAALMLRLRRH